MDLAEEVEQLRRYLDELAGYEDACLARYELRRPPMPPGLYWRLRWLAGWCLRWLESVGLRQPDRWPPRLSQVSGSARAKPFLIWAIGADRDTLREACRAFAELSRTLPNLAPVLVTDVADFAFFSRLAWLVEYVPELSGDGEPYHQRKLKFLARLYRGAPVLPVRAGLEITLRDAEIRRWVSESRPRILGRL
jgi:hypothetical protein